MIFRAETCCPSLLAFLVFCDASSWIFRERTKIQGIQSASHYISISLSRLYMVLLSNKVITWGYFWHYFESQLMFIFVWFSSLPTSDCTDRFMIPRLVFLRLRLPAAVFPLHIRCMEMYEVCGSFILTNLWHTRPRVQLPKYRDDFAVRQSITQHCRSAGRRIGFVGKFAPTPIDSFSKTFIENLCRLQTFTLEPGYT